MINGKHVVVYVVGGPSAYTDVLVNHASHAEKFTFVPMGEERTTASLVGLESFAYTRERHAVGRECALMG